MLLSGVLANTMDYLCECQTKFYLRSRSITAFSRIIYREELPHTNGSHNGIPKNTGLV